MMYTIAFSVLIAFPICVVLWLAFKTGKLSPVQSVEMAYQEPPSVSPASDEAARSKIIELEATLAHLRKRGKRAVAERDIAIAERDRWQKRAMRAEQSLVQVQAQLKAQEVAPSTGTGKKYDQLKRFIAKEFHPDFSGRSGVDRLSRTEMFTLMWTKVEEIDKA